MQKELVIFLDFDGVLHHIFPVKGNTDQENEMFHYVDYLEKAMKVLSDKFDLKIVFATSWKEKFSFDDLKGFFEDYPACYNAFIDSTPNIKSHDQGYKWREAVKWMEDNNYSGHYIIIDDYAPMWDGCDSNNIVVCQDKFNDTEISSLLEKTSLMLNQKKGFSPK